MREAQRLTQEQVADKTGLDQTTVSQLETGRAKDARYSTLKALAQAYGCTPDDIARAHEESIAEAAA